MDYRNIPELVRSHVSTWPDNPFLFSELDGRSWTYAEFDAAVRSTAAMLAARGIGKGDVVSLLLPNSPEYIVAYFACWHIGAIAGPVNSLLKREEIEWVVSNSESKLLLVHSTMVPVPGEDQKEWDVCVPYVLFDDLPSDESDLGISANIAPDDEAVIIYTSGTTGKPKGCLLTHGNLIANARQITEWMNFTPEDRLLTVMPLFHMNAVTVTTMTALYCGGSTVVSPKFSASRFWDVIDKYQITSFGSVATMLLCSWNAASLTACRLGAGGP